MDISTQIDLVKINNLTRKFKMEYDYLSNNCNMNIFTNVPNIELRLKNLEYLLETISINKQNETIQQKRNNIFKEINKYTYKKQWNKLLPFHKIFKIKEFINEIILDKNMQNEIIDKLSNYINTGKINTKKYVVYDPNLEKILSIPCLIYNNDNNTYKLNIINIFKVFINILLYYNIL